MEGTQELQVRGLANHSPFLFPQLKPGRWVGSEGGLLDPTSG